jgi:hypothetical protein
MRADTCATSLANLFSPGSALQHSAIDALAAIGQIWRRAARAALFAASSHRRAVRAQIRQSCKPMDLFLQQVLNGLTLGGIYSLVALGLTLVYGILHVPNFAHGAFYMAGAFASFHLMKVWGFNYWIAMAGRHCAWPRSPRWPNTAVLFSDFRTPPFNTVRCP